jgi:hypothetical protein
LDVTTTCHACPAGRYIEDGQDDTKHGSINECKICPKGYEFKDQISECQMCTFSQYQDQINIDGVKCHTCPAGRYIKDARQDDTNHDSLSDCKTCPTGYELKDQTDAWQFCTFGPYQDQTDIDSVKCKRCAANKYIADDREIAAAHLSESSCLDCSAGKFSNSGAQFCEACAVGKERVDSSCVACIAGQYSKFIDGLFTCQNCLAGLYQAEPGQPFCLPCIPVRVFCCCCFFVVFLFLICNLFLRAVIKSRVIFFTPLSPLSSLLPFFCSYSNFSTGQAW